MKSKNWFFIYHANSIKEWSTPKGIASALKKLGINLIEFTFNNPDNFNLPPNEYFIKNQISTVLTFYAGKNKILEKDLLRLKNELNIIIVCELGDEPQTLIHNDQIVRIANISLTPDYRSSLYWQNQGNNCVWFSHWADTKLYKKNSNKSKNIFIGTTMGRRRYHFLLKVILGNSYFNKRCSPEENVIIYQQSKIVFQYARWNEVTRRLFEAAACECCLLTNKLPEHTQIETIFAHNVSAVYYSDTFSLIYQIIRLKLKPDLRKKIANNAYNIVMKNHTEVVRARKIIALVEKHRLKNKF